MGFREALVALVTPREKVEPAEERSSYYAASAPAFMTNAIVPQITPNTASQSVAVGSTVDLIASLTSELPIDVVDANDKKLPTPSYLDDPGGDGNGREDWGYRLVSSWCYTGNGFGDVIEFDKRTGAIITADLIAPEFVSPTIVDGAPVWYVNGREVTRPQAFKHWRVYPVAGRLMGRSQIEYHAAIIGVTLATTRFGRAWFDDGAHASGILLHDGDLDPEQSAIAKARFMATQGSGEPVILGGKWKDWKQIQISPEESQFLQTAGMSEAQCCRIYGPGYAEILGYETGQKMTYGNVVDRRQDLLVLGLNRWFRRYQRVLSMFVPNGQRVVINRDALLEATTLQRYQANLLALHWRPVNEIRAIEKLAPIAGGDTLTPPAAAAIAAQPNTQGGTSDGNTSGS